MEPTALAAGVATTIITPPLGAPLLGPTSPATGVHDDLYARALVLSDGQRAAALVSLDLVGLDLAQVGQIEAEVRRQAGVDLVLLLCSHTHSAPFTIPWSLLGRAWLTEPDGARWCADLVTNIAAACRDAAAWLEPVSLRAGRADAAVGMNRRLPTDGGIVMTPNADGATVPWVDVLCVDRADGTPLAVLFAHAAHPVIVHAASTLISADYPGAAVAAVQRELGDGVVAMFAQACGANINGQPLRGGFEAAEAAGEALGQAVLQAVVAARPVPAGPLRLAHEAATLPLRPLPALDTCRGAVAEAEQRLAAAEAAGATDLFAVRDDVLCARDLLARAERGAAPEMPFAASGLAVGDAWGLVAMTHEVFAEYQLWLEQVSPWRDTMVAAYTNGCESYVPTDAALAEGGYEGLSFPDKGAAWRYPYRVALAPGAEERVRDVLRVVLRKLGG